MGSVPTGTLRKLSSPPMPPVLTPERSPRPPSERGTRPPPELATENDLYDNNRSVSFGFVEKGNPPADILQFVRDVVKDTGKEEYLRRLVCIGLD